jgi:hypothetical protein
MEIAIDRTCKSVIWLVLLFEEDFKNRDTNNTDQ